MKSFKIGDRIKAYDFKPAPNRTEDYIEGEIVELYNKDYLGYSVKVDYDNLPALDPEYADHSRVGEIIIVPLQISFGEFDRRVTKLS